MQECRRRLSLVVDKILNTNYLRLIIFLSILSYYLLIIVNEFSLRIVKFFYPGKFFKLKVKGFLKVFLSQFLITSYIEFICVL